VSKRKEKQEANFEFYIRFGDHETINMDALNQKEKEKIGVRLNDTALQAIGYVPEEDIDRLM